MQDKIKIIVDAIDIAVQKGCYNLNDTAVIITALKEVFPADVKEKEDE
jgi:uncharacterized membrane protein (UPF0182 family)